jgi:N-acetylmuramoyl-L-alanine amidase
MVVRQYRLVRKDSMAMLLPRSALLSMLASWLTVAPLFAGQTGAASHVEVVRYWSFGDVTRLVIETVGDYRFTSEAVANPPRIYFDLIGLKPPSSVKHGMQTIAVGDRLLKQIRVAEAVPGTTRVVLDVTAPVDIVSSQLVNPDRLIIEIRPKDTPPAITQNLRHSLTGAQRVNLSAPTLEMDRDLPPPVIRPVIASSLEKPKALDPPMTSPVIVTTTTTTNPPARVTTIVPAKPPAANTAADPSLVRVLGLKLGRVVIDAGHGGKDTGTIGSNGLLEKDLVLDVALRLGRLITKQLGAEVVYTRSDDTFIPLGERTAIANRARADLFISVHANSSSDPSATGVETYYFNLHGDKKATDVAMRENATDENAISDLNDLLKKAVLQTKLEESKEFAQKIQDALAVNSIKMNSNAHDRGVRKAPFVVLIGASMPSILAEIGFVSNPRDEKQLKKNDQREKIAEALLKGVTEYANTLSHPQMASAGGSN